MKRTVAGLAAVLVIGALLAGCGGAPTPAPSPSPSVTPSGDGVLRIGTLFPSSGGVAFIGPSQVAGVNAAVRAINAAGGVGGHPVEVISRDSGDASSQQAEAAFAELVAAGVDVVIGPSSSVLAQRLLPAAEEARVPLVSPAAASPVVSSADTSGWFFRTIASYDHQAGPLAELLSAKVSSIALVSGGDPVTDSLRTPLTAQLKKAKIAITARDDLGTPVADIVAKVVAAKPGGVVLATPDNGATTLALISALSAAGYGGGKLWFTSLDTADYSQALPAGLLSGATGLLSGATPAAGFAAVVRQEDPGVHDLSYAAEAFDAVTLAALAAEAAGDDGGATIAAGLGAASTSGVLCTSYGECRAALEAGQDIAYDGVSGPVDLDAAGDPTRGSFSVQRYDGANRLSFVKSLSG
ncbi:MAG TPA: ABC transporter substrate-binding protein [Pseudolysinimonas sp.]|nr:ABC transporter substrate-binding protein [Pseudolysinimonas sp.]